MITETVVIFLERSSDQFL